MKKSLIALAVAGALTAPMIAQADATLYGTAQYRGIKAEDSGWKNNMAKTRLGVKGTVDNDVEGLTTGFQFEWEFVGDDQSGSDVNMRKSHVYLKGDFGLVDLGTQNNPVQAAEGMGGTMGRHGNNYGLVSDRITNGAAYVSPNFGGAQVYVAQSANTSSDNEAYAYGIDWSGMGLSLSAGVIDSKVNATAASAATYKQDPTSSVSSIIVDSAAVAAKAANDEQTVAFGVGYSGVENLYVGVSFVTVESDDTTLAGATDEENLMVGVAYTMGKYKLVAEYEAKEDATVAETLTSSPDSGKIGVGVNYSLGAKAALAVEYYDFDSDAEKNGDKDTLVLQYTLSF